MYVYVLYNICACVFGSVRVCRYSMSLFSELCVCMRCHRSNRAHALMQVDTVGRHAGVWGLCAAMCGYIEVWMSSVNACREIEILCTINSYSTMCVLRL